MALEDKARGQRLAQMRKLRRLTQQQMCEKLGVAYRTYQTWEAGTLPEWHNIEKVAKFFGVRPEDWIGEDDIVLSANGDGASQLDRIEEMLEEVLALLRADNVAGTSVNRIAAAVREVLADGQSGATQPARGGKSGQSGAKRAARQAPARGTRKAV